MRKSHIAPGEKDALKLTAAEVEAILEGVRCLDRKYEQLIQESLVGKPVMMTLDELDDFGGYIAAEANHTEDKSLGRKLDKVFGKCLRLLETYTDEPGDRLAAEQAEQKLTTGIKGGAEPPSIVSFLVKSKTPKTAKFPIKITQLQRDSLCRCTRLKAAIRKRVESAEGGTQVIEFTKKELDHLQDELGQVVVYARSPHKQRLVAVQKKVEDILDKVCLEDFGFEKPRQRRPASKSDLLVQLKISLLHIRPTIWRRIQIRDCTLGVLHEHIQSVMGWENCHLHEFIIGGERYGTVMTDDLGFGDDGIDESRVRLTDVLPQSGKRFRFQYVYDFGDDWRHEILFEGYPPAEKAKKFPLCLEGERACPPEDVGGPWGYAECLDALADPSHEGHDEMVEWIGPFDAEAFSVEEATKSMQTGLPKF